MGGQGRVDFLRRVRVQGLDGLAGDGDPVTVPVAEAPVQNPGDEALDLVGGRVELDRSPLRAAASKPVTPEVSRRRCWP